MFGVYVAVFIFESRVVGACIYICSRIYATIVRQERRSLDVEHIDWERSIAR